MPLKESEIKRILSKKGLHVSSFVICYDIINNEGLKKVEVKIRADRDTKNENTLCEVFQSKAVIEKIEPEKPFLMKPKSDLISGSINLMDTQMSLKYKNKNLETSKTEESGKPSNYSKLSS